MRKKTGLSSNERHFTFTKKATMFGVDPMMIYPSKKRTMSL
jgi:hypothetical protein